MNELTTQMTNEFKPRQAIIIYEETRQEYNSQQYYLETHHIDASGHLGQGMPLQQEHISRMVEFFSERHQKETTVKGIIPTGMLYANYNSQHKILVWWTPEQKQMMHFTKELHIAKGEAMQPALLWVLNDRELSLYAFKGKPTEKTQLYRAPYHNVHNDGDVCLGSARAKRHDYTYTGIIGYYHTLFWNSEFSHLATGNSPIKGNVNTYWKTACKAVKKTPFKNSVLIRQGKLTLGSLLKQIAR